MKKYIILIVFAWYSIISCQDSANESQDTDTIIDESSIEVSVANPNGDSELALLMKKLVNDADSLKHVIASGKGNISVDYLTTIHKNLSAEATDPNVKTDEFTAFNNIFENSAKELLLSDSNHIEGFNKMIGNCVNCHNTFCPGPISRIEKLRIKTNN